MRQLLSGLSIKLQVVVPVVFTLLLLVAGISYSTTTLKHVFNQVSLSTEGVITHKDDLTKIIDNTYGMASKPFTAYFVLKTSSSSLIHFSKNKPSALSY